MWPVRGYALASENNRARSSVNRKLCRLVAAGMVLFEVKVDREVLWPLERLHYLPKGAVCPE